MFWMFLIAVAAAFVFISLGAMSVWVGVMFVWRRYKGDRSGQ